MNSFSNKSLISAFQKSWSLKSSSKWTENNPALGQCGVTALVAQDHLGGKIVKTKVVKPAVELWHFYNLINNQPVDFTSSQFDEPIKYGNQESNREEAFVDTNSEQYAALKLVVENNLKNP